MFTKGKSIKDLEKIKESFLHPTSEASFKKVREILILLIDEMIEQRKILNNEFK